MKFKNLFAVVMLAACGVSVMAQTQSEEKVVFKSHSYLQLQGGISHTLGEAEFTDLLSPAAALSFGYQFSPVWGARIGVSGWESRGGWVNPSVNYKYNYLAGNLDVTMNLSNLICKYNPKRIFNLSLFLGGAVNYAFNNDEAENLALILRDNKFFAMPYLWHDSKVLGVGRGGLIADFRVSERISLNLEANANIISDHYNSKKAGNSDWYFNALAGITFRLSKPTKTVAPLLPQPVSASPVQKSAEPVVKEVVKVVEKPVEAYTCDIFFELNSSVINSTEEAKVNQLAEYLKKYPEAKVIITGYADVKTGNAKINLSLSQDRAKKVAEMLSGKYGISASRITTAFKGDTEQPFSDNIKNRVCICWAK